MMPFADLSDLPRQLRQPQVRDLAWVLLAPPMLSVTPWPQRHPLAGSDWVRQPERLRGWLLALEAGRERIAGKDNTVMALRVVYTPGPLLERSW